MSVDISEQQLNVARNRAAQLDLEVDFVCAEVVDLSALHEETYDLVYTGGHVAVWVSDLRRLHGEAARILRPDGRLVVSEYHPFRRCGRKPATNLNVGFNYFHRGPHRSEVAPDVCTCARRIGAIRISLDRRRLHLWHPFFRVSAHPRRGSRRSSDKLGRRANGWASDCASTSGSAKQLGGPQQATPLVRSGSIASRNVRPLQGKTRQSGSFQRVFAQRGREYSSSSAWMRRRACIEKIMHQPSSINLMLLGLNGWPRSLRWPAAASSALILRSDRHAPVGRRPTLLHCHIGLRERLHDSRSASRSARSMRVLRPSHLPRS